jgi:hypothetical protein
MPAGVVEEMELFKLSREFLALVVGQQCPPYMT